MTDYWRNFFNNGKTHYTGIKIQHAQLGNEYSNILN